MFHDITLEERFDNLGKRFREDGFVARNGRNSDLPTRSIILINPYFVHSRAYEEMSSTRRNRLNLNSDRGNTLLSIALTDEMLKEGYDPRLDPYENVSRRKLEIALRHTLSELSVPYLLTHDKRDVSAVSELLPIKGIKIPKILFFPSFYGTQVEEDLNFDEFYVLQKKCDRRDEVPHLRMVS